MKLKHAEFSELISTPGHDKGIRVRSTSVAADSLDPDQARRFVRPDLDPNCLTLLWHSSKIFFPKKLSSLLNLKGPIASRGGPIPYFIEGYTLL